MKFKLSVGALLLMSAALSVYAQPPARAANRLPSAVNDADYYENGAPSE